MKNFAALFCIISLVNAEFAKEHLDAQQSQITLDNCTGQKSQKSFIQRILNDFGIKNSSIECRMRKISSEVILFGSLILFTESLILLIVAFLVLCKRK
ncbi:MAG: hypothetical protein MHMPM18_000886 [Marteilia pararefringens]